MNVLFDVDGVLIDGWHSNPARRKPWDIAIEQDLGIDRDAFRRRFFEPTQGTFDSPMHACVEGKRDLKLALAEVLPGLGYTGSVDTFVRYWFEKDSNVNRAVLAVVERLAKNETVKLYVATGQEHYRAAYLWNELGFKRFFSDIFYSAKLRHLKTSPEFFGAVNAILGAQDNESPVFFDDQADVVRIAREAQWDATVFDSITDITEHPRLKPYLQYL